jgi:hypothetical protein
LETTERTCRSRQTTNSRHLLQCIIALELLKAASLRLNIELARERLPMRLHLADQLRG